MNCRMMFALAMVLAAVGMHRTPQPAPSLAAARPAGMSLALKAGAFAFTLCTGSAVCR